MKLESGYRTKVITDNREGVVSAVEIIAQGKDNGDKKPMADVTEELAEILTSPEAEKEFALRSLKQYIRRLRPADEEDIAGQSLVTGSGGEVARARAFDHSHEKWFPEPIEFMGTEMKQHEFVEVVVDEIMLKKPLSGIDDPRMGLIDKLQPGPSYITRRDVQ